jgi:predicted transcriptional regulator of viral defense system
MKYILVALTLSFSACSSAPKYCGTTVTYGAIVETKEELGCITNITTVDPLTLQPK